MKTLKFKQNLVSPILSGEKTSTWRLFDDKNLQTGDVLSFVNKETGEEFAQAEIVSIKGKHMKDIVEDDLSGHKKYESMEDMLETYRGYYGDKVSPESIMKMVEFMLM